MHSYFQPSSRTVRLSVALTLAFLVAGCSATDVLGSLLGGGPNVAANGQIGATNQQGVNITTEAPSVTVRPKGRIDNLNQSTTNNTNTDWWIILLLIIGWLAPSPSEIGRGITKLWRKNA